MAREYISVDRHDRDTSQIVKLTSTENSFTGEFFIPVGDEIKNIRELFGGEGNVIETIKVNGTALTPDADKAVDITIPDAGDKNVIESITVNGTPKPVSNKTVDITIPDAGQNNVIETIKVNNVALVPENKAVNIEVPDPGSQVIQVEFTKPSVDHDDIFGKLFLQGNTIRSGDIIVCKRHFTEEEKNYTAVATYVVIGSVGNYDLLPVSPSKIKGGLAGSIDAVLDENGDSVFQIDEIEFQELHTNELYIEGKEIRTLLPNLSGLKTLQKLKNPNKMKDISDKVNDLIDLLKGAANAQHL